VEVEAVKRPQYSMTITWSNEDNVYVAQCRELPGCTAHGDTPTIAALELTTAMNAVVAVMQDDGMPMPEPLPFALIPLSVQDSPNKLSFPHNVDWNAVSINHIDDFDDVWKYALVSNHKGPQDFGDVHLTLDRDADPKNDHEDFTCLRYLLSLAQDLQNGKLVRP